MDGLAVVGARRDARLGEPAGEPVGVVRAHHEQVVARGSSPSRGSGSETMPPRPGVRVRVRQRAAALVPTVETCQGDSQHRRLDRVEPRVPADQLIGDLVAGPVEAQQPRALRSAGSAVAIAPPSPRQKRFLEGKKLKVATSPSVPARLPSQARAGGLCGVLEHRQRRGPASSSRSASIGATRPNRSTAITARVSGVSAALDGLRR